MGDVCDKFFLVVFGTGDFAGHIGEGGGQIADFILAVHLKFVMHIAAGILFGSLRDFAEREVHDLRKKYKDNQRKKEQNNQHNIGNIQQTVAGRLDGAHGSMDHNVSPYFKIRSNGRKHTEHLLIKRTEEVAHSIIRTGGHGGIKIFDNNFVFYIYRRRRVQYHPPGRIDDPYGG